MSLRNRIVTLFVLVILVAPAAGWAKAGIIDPDGSPAANLDDSTSSVDDSTEEQSLSSSIVWNTEASDENLGRGSLLDRFLVWLHALVQPL